MFLQKETSHCRECSVIFSAVSFTQKMPESSDSLYSSIFKLENIWYSTFTLFRPNSPEIMNFVSIMGPGDPN